SVLVTTLPCAAGAAPVLVKRSSRAQESSAAGQKQKNSDVQRSGASHLVTPPNQSLISEMKCARNFVAAIRELQSPKLGSSPRLPNAQSAALLLYRHSAPERHMVSEL